MALGKRKIVWAIVALIVGAATLLCVLKWKTWFGQPDEPPYVVADYPHRLMLTFGNDGEFSRNVSWQCDSVLLPSRLEIIDLVDSTLRIIPAAGEIFRSRAGVAAYYVARIDSLRPGATYSYRALSGNRVSDTYTFTVQPSGGKKVEFIFVGDVQDTIGGLANTYIIKAFEKHPSAKFLVSGGDLVERPRDINWAEAFRSVDSICTALPMIVATGNHDYLKGIPYRLERRFPLVFSYFLDSQVADNMVYSLRYGPAEFFVLDSTREFPYLFTQRGWLKKRLAESEADWKIVVVHHPLYSLKHKSTNLVPRLLFADVIEDAGVDLVLQGHEHNYARVSHGKRPTVYTISHCSPKSYSHHNDDAFDVTDFDNRYYQYIRIDGDTLTVAAYDVNTDRLVDTITLHH